MSLWFARIYKQPRVCPEFQLEQNWTKVGSLESSQKVSSLYPIYFRIYARCEVLRFRKARWWQGKQEEPCLPWSHRTPI